MVRPGTRRWPGGIRARREPVDRSVRRRLAAIATAVVVVGATWAAPVAAQGPTHLGGFGRWLVVAKSSADYAGLKADVLAGGGRILREIPDIDTLVVAGGANVPATTR